MPGHQSPATGARSVARTVMMIRDTQPGLRRSSGAKPHRALLRLSSRVIAIAWPDVPITKIFHSHAGFAAAAAASPRAVCAVTAPSRPSWPGSLVNPASVRNGTVSVMAPAGTRFPAGFHPAWLSPGWLSPGWLGPGWPSPDWIWPDCSAQPDGRDAPLRRARPAGSRSSQIGAQPGAGIAPGSGISGQARARGPTLTWHSGGLRPRISPSASRSSASSRSSSSAGASSSRGCASHGRSASGPDDELPMSSSETPLSPGASPFPGSSPGPPSPGPPSPGPPSPGPLSSGPLSPEPSPGLPSPGPPSPGLPSPGPPSPGPLSSGPLSPGPSSPP